VSSTSSKQTIMQKQRLWARLSTRAPLILCALFYAASYNVDSIDTRAAFSLIAFLAGGAIVMDILFIVVLRSWLEAIPVVSILACVAVLAVSIFSVLWSGFGLYYYQGSSGKAAIIKYKNDRCWSFLVAPIYVNSDTYSGHLWCTSWLGMRDSKLRPGSFATGD